MIESVYNFFATIFENSVVLATIFISMVPIIEVKGAIPFATSEVIWDNLAISNWQAFGWASLGCSIVVVLLALLYKPIIALLKKSKIIKNFGSAIENFILSKSNMVEEMTSANKNIYWKKILFIFVFVAIPLPFTGVWTGTCIAICMNIDYLSTCITVILGNLVAGLLVTLILQFFPFLNDWLFFIFLGIVTIFIIIKIVVYFKNKRKKSV